MNYHITGTVTLKIDTYAATHDADEATEAVYEAISEGLRNTGIEFEFGEESDLELEYEDEEEDEWSFAEPDEDEEMEEAA